jgi:hypothetical protein
MLEGQARSVGSGIPREVDPLAAAAAGWPLRRHPSGQPGCHWLLSLDGQWYPGLASLPVQSWTPPDRSTSDHPRCQSKSIDSSVDDPATVTPSSHYTASNLLIIPRRNPKIRPCTPEPCRMVGRGTLSALPRGVHQWGTPAAVGYGYPTPPGPREGWWNTLVERHRPGARSPDSFVHTSGL